MKMTILEQGYAAKLAKALVDAKLMYDCSDMNQVLGEGDDWRKSKYGIGVKFTTKSAYDLPSSEDVSVAEITMSGMYDFDFRGTIPLMETVAQVFGSRKINVGRVEGYSSGCDTCGYGGRYEQKLFVFEPVVGKE